MKNSQKKLIILTIFGLLLNIHVINAQTAKETEIYNLYDKTVGKHNLDSNNGVLYTNPYKTLDDSYHIYFSEDKFEKGTLSYDGQIYFDTSLKYDVYRDIVILNPDGASELIGISLNKEKVESFSLYNRKFVKLIKEQYTLPNLTTGYYEISENNKDFILYIKHSKAIQKKVKEDGIYYEFKPNSSYLLYYMKNLYAVDNKSDILKIFPDQKKQINEFYLMNREVRKSDTNQFMKNLMKHINNSLPNKNK